MVATACYVAKRGATWLRSSCNVARTWSNEAGRKLEFLTYLNFEHIKNPYTFSATYNDVAATYSQRNYSVTWHITTWLGVAGTCKNACGIHTLLCYVSDTFWHAMLRHVTLWAHGTYVHVAQRFGTLRYVVYRYTSRNIALYHGEIRCASSIMCCCTNMKRCVVRLMYFPRKLQVVATPTVLFGVVLAPRPTGTHWTR